MNNETSGDHHVAWKDRVDLDRLWHEDMKACSATYGTSEHPIMIERFEADIVNIKNGPKLDDEVISFRKKVEQEGEKIFQLWERDNFRASKAEGRDKRKQIKSYIAKRMHKFLFQLMEDHGYGTYAGGGHKKGADGYQKYGKEENDEE